MKNYRLHLIRHGRTNLDGKGLYLGCKTDPELSPEGIRGLLRLREHFEYPPVEMVYASPMARCVQTAGVLYPDAGMTTVPQLREADFGEFEGKSIQELKDNPEYVSWLSNSLKNAPPGGENGEDFLLRVVEGFRFVLEDMMRCELYDAAIIAHGGVIMSLLAAIGLPRRQVYDWQMANGQGFTCFVNPQLWQRDQLIEVAGILPHGASSALKGLEQAVEQ